MLASPVCVHRHGTCQIFGAAAAAPHAVKGSHGLPAKTATLVQVAYYKWTVLGVCSLKCIPHHTIDHPSHPFISCLQAMPNQLSSGSLPSTITCLITLLTVW
jgi:hypothetical protein